MKSKIIIGLIVTLTIGSVFFITNNSTRTSDDSANTIATKESKGPRDTLDQLVDNIRSGGPPKDGIPPIDQPNYLGVDEINLSDHDKVFVYESPSGVYIYPQNILVWHEIVNDLIDGQPLSITYCPLTGSTICYLNDSDHPENNYGTSGKLLNSNLVMYDRETDSYIPQILGVGINNALKGTVIPTRPIHWANWGEVKTLYPNANVLSLETGFFRDYGNDPYETYLPDDKNSYYLFGEPLFPVLHTDNRFLDKKVVVGVKYKDSVLAIDPTLVREEKIVEFEISGLKAVAIYDAHLKTVRIFSRLLDDKLLSFTATQNGFEDQYTNNWSYNGQYNDQQLSTITYFDVMWFAWYAYYPDTEVIE